MSTTWEERMGSAARARRRAEEDRREAERAAEDAAEDNERRLASEPLRLAGPPHGCHRCYEFLPGAYYTGYWHWAHTRFDYDTWDFCGEYGAHSLCFCGCHLGHGDRNWGPEPAYPYMQYHVAMA